MLKIENINSIVAFLRSENKNAKAAKLLTVAIAYAVPLTNHETPYDLREFTEQMGKIGEGISTINEEHLIPVKKITEEVREVFLYRVRSIEVPQTSVPAAVRDLEEEDVIDIQTLKRQLKEIF